MQSTLIGLLSLGIIVLVHELGHYIVAVYYGVEVEEFAIGLGPKLFSIQKPRTLWSIRLLPLGGFCKMKSPPLHATENTSDTIPKEEGSFSSMPYRGKALILLGGPLANMLLFVLLSILIFTIGNKEYDILPSIEPIANPAKASTLVAGDTITAINDIPIKTYSQLSALASKLKSEVATISYVAKDSSSTKTVTIQLNATPPTLGVMPYIAPVVNSVPSDSIAQTLGLQIGDTIVEINAEPLTNAIYIPNYFVDNNSNTPIQLWILRDGKRIKYELLPSVQFNSIADFGIRIDTIAIKKWSSLADFAQSRSAEAYRIMSSTFLFMVELLRFNTKDIMQNTAGPIRLISIVGNNTLSSASEHGWYYAIVQLLNITALLSLAIASLNLLPIPVLDGGQLAFYTFFYLRRKEPKIKYLLRYNGIGAILLLILFGFILFSDIISFF